MRLRRGIGKVAYPYPACAASLSVHSTFACVISTSMANMHALEARGFLATVFQHEFDHLDGRLFVDRIQDPTRLAFEEEFARYVLPSESDGEPAAAAD